MKRIAILGAGISGLTLAYCLSKKGHSVAVYEKAARPGGLARTLAFNDQYYDLGPHEFCTENPRLQDLLAEILDTDLLVRQKKVAQYFRGKFLDYPIKPFHLLGQMDRGLVARIGLESLGKHLLGLLRSAPDRSFADWVKNRFGRTLYQEYFEPYTRKVWGIDPEMLDPKTAADRISFSGILDLLVKTWQYACFKKEQHSARHNPLKARFFYARGGIGRLVQRLEEKCREAGCRIFCNWPLERIVVENQQVTGLRNQAGEAAAVHDGLINTTPLTTLNRALGHDGLNVRLRYRAMLFCCLELSVSRLSPYHWIYFPESGQRIQRLSDFSRFDAEMTRPGRTGLCAEIACFPGDRFWNADDSEIIDWVVEDLRAAGLLPRGASLKGWVHREEHAYPLQVTGYQQEARQALESIRSVANLFTLGRQGLFRYCNMNECMEMAMEMAESIDQDQPVNLSPDSSWKGADLEWEALPS